MGKALRGQEQSMCGWLKDQFAVWWQVVPDVLGKLLDSGDPSKAQRVMAAIMMKLNIKGLEDV